VVSTVSDKDLLVMGDLLSAAADPTTPGGLADEVLVGLADLVPCDFAAFTDMEPSAQKHHVHQDVEGGVTVVPTDDDTAFWKHYWDSPFCSFPSRTGDDRTVTLLSDFQSSREWLSSGMYAECFADVGVQRELMCCLPSQGTRSRRVIFFRGPGGDFDDRDRLVMALLRPHLTELLERTRVAELVPHPLTARQTELLRLVAQGRSTSQIAEALFLSTGTVRKHIENIFERLGVSNRTAAVMRVFGESAPAQAEA
jgi:DNA-binding CsgD family transcriptional regulator